MRWLVFFLAVWIAWAATVKLYLKDGTYHLVREYQVQTDRVRYYSVERGDWEEIPLDLVDLKRTRAEAEERTERLLKETAEIAAEEKAEREQRQEVERVPDTPGAYLARDGALAALKQAESKVVTNKGRAVLKVLAPLPVVAGKSTVELDGAHAVLAVESDRPEFYFRLSQEERFGIVRLTPKKSARVVQKWSIVPITKELVEEEEQVEIFRKQLDDGLYKIWPVKPLPPGEYAVIEYTQGKGNVQVWDFGRRAAAQSR